MLVKRLVHFSDRNLPDFFFTSESPEFTTPLLSRRHLCAIITRMKTIVAAIFLLSFASPLLLAAEPLLSMPGHGKFQKEGEAIVFVPDERRSADRQKSSGLDAFKQWHVIGAELQPKVRHRPTETIVTGGVGHFNIGMLRPYGGIPIFAAWGNKQPRLVGMTDANGRFAVKLPLDFPLELEERQGVEKDAKLYLFFSGTIDVVTHRFPYGKRPIILHGG